MKSILVNIVPEETRMAMLEEDELLAVEVERPAHSHLVGNIYKGMCKMCFRECKRLLLILVYPELLFYTSMIWYGRKTNLLQMFLNFCNRVKF